LARPIGYGSDNNDLTPSKSTNGWLSLSTGPNQGINCWTNYAVMKEELGQSPRVVQCPSDERTSATNFSHNQGSGFGNTNVSYFVGVDASDTYPQSILEEIATSARPQAINDYGYSPSSGVGNDVTVFNQYQDQPHCLVPKNAFKRKHARRGNLLLGDGSIQQCSSLGLRKNYQSVAFIRPPAKGIQRNVPTGIP